MPGGAHHQLRRRPPAGLRACILMLAALLVCLPCSIRSSSRGPRHPDPDYLASVTIDPSATGRLIPTGFLGISHDPDQALLLAGDPEAGINPVYRQLLSNLIAAGAGHLVIRIGGPATDRAAGFSPQYLRSLAGLFRDLSNPDPQVSFILGINLASGDPGLAVSQTRACLAALPAGSVTALEIGHEPDRYALRHIRPENYRFPDYLKDFQLTREIRKAVPAAPGFAGPSFSGTAGGATGGFASLNGLRELMRTTGLTTISLHATFAAGTACGGAPRSGMLLDPAAATSGPETAAGIMKGADVKKAYRITELNALSCAEPGISDSFESALWLVDILFDYAGTGVSGVNLHSNNWSTDRGWNAGSLFLFDVPGQQYQSSGLPGPPDAATVRDYALKAVSPMYYGMLLFAEAAASGSSLVPAGVNTEANVRAWATRDDRTGELRVVLINKEQDLPGRIRISVPGYKSGKVKRLMAPSYRSQSGISFAGQTFDGSTDGKPLGKPETELISSQESAFEVPIGPVSAVLITFQK